MGLSGWNANNILKLTIDSSNVDKDLTDFPVLITLSSGSGKTNYDATGVFDALTTTSGSYDNRKKIAITTTISDVETQLYVEIECWADTASSGSEQAWLWTKVPTIASGTDTELLLYYDSDQAINSGYVGDTGDTPAQNVWDSNFVGVWGLDDTYNGTADEVKDSTSNESHMKSEYTHPTLVDGVVKKLQNFTTGGFAVADGTNLDNESEITVEALVKFDNIVDAYQHVITNLDNVGATTQGVTLQLQTSNLHFYIYHGSTSNNVTFSNVQADTWYQVAGTYKDGETDGSRIYINGTLQTDETYSGLLARCGSHYHIGYRGSSYLRQLDGKVGDVRVSNIARSAAWVKVTYYSNWDNLITFEKGDGYYFSGYVYEQSSPVARTLYLHTRYDGSLVATTTSSGNGYYYLETTYSGAHYIVCLDDAAGSSYNDLIIGNVTPTTISG